MVSDGRSRPPGPPTRTHIHTHTHTYTKAVAHAHSHTHKHTSTRKSGLPFRNRVAGHQWFELARKHAVRWRFTATLLTIPQVRIRHMQTLNLLYVAWMNGHFEIVGGRLGNKQTHRPIRWRWARGGSMAKSRLRRMHPRWLETTTPKRLKRGHLRLKA